MSYDISNTIKNYAKKATVLLTTLPLIATLGYGKIIDNSVKYDQKLLKKDGNYLIGVKIDAKSDAKKNILVNIYGTSGTKLIKTDSKLTSARFGFPNRTASYTANLREEGTSETNGMIVPIDVIEQVPNTQNAKAKKARAPWDYVQDRDEFWFSAGSSTTNSSLTRSDGVLVEDKQTNNDTNYKGREKAHLNKGKNGITFDLEGYLANSKLADVNGTNLAVGLNRILSKDGRAWALFGINTQALSGDGFEQSANGFLSKLGYSKGPVEVEGVFAKRNGDMDIENYGSLPVSETEKGLFAEYRGKKAKARFSMEQIVGPNSNVTATGLGASYAPLGRGMFLNADYARTSGTGVLGSKLTGNAFSGGIEMDNSGKRILKNVWKGIRKIPGFRKGQTKAKPSQANPAKQSGQKVK